MTKSRDSISNLVHLNIKVWPAGLSRSPLLEQKKTWVSNELASLSGTQNATCPSTHPKPTPIWRWTTNRAQQSCLNLNKATILGRLNRISGREGPPSATTSASCPDPEQHSPASQLETSSKHLPQTKLVVSLSIKVLMVISRGTNIWCVLQMCIHLLYRAEQHVTLAASYLLACTLLFTIDTRRTSKSNPSSWMSPPPGKASPRCLNPTQTTRMDPPRKCSDTSNESRLRYNSNSTSKILKSSNSLSGPARCTASPSNTPARTSKWWSPILTPTPSTALCTSRTCLKIQIVWATRPFIINKHQFLAATCTDHTGSRLLATNLSLACIWSRCNSATKLISRTSKIRKKNRRRRQLQKVCLRSLLVLLLRVVFSSKIKHHHAKSQSNYCSQLSKIETYSTPATNSIG